RAETSVAQNKQALIQARLAATQADVRLKRVVGVALADPLTLSSIPSGSAALAAGPHEAAALAQAQTDRVELRIVEEQVKAESSALNAARANHLPTLSAAANYGLSGNTPDGTARTGAIGGRLDLPIFSGGAVHGQVVESRGRLAAARSRA